MDNEQISAKIKELQVLEQNFQMFMHQKQSIQVELNEIVNAFKEVKDSSGDVYKVLSGIMVKSEKNSLLKELEEKKKTAELKLDSFEKQESKLNSRIQLLRAEISKFASKKNN
ncbi:MAG: prefoldin subunit [Nanoarchaeota archaeon]